MSALASAKQEFHYDEAGNVVPLEELPPPAPPAPAEPYYWEDGGDEEAAALKRMKHTAHWAATGVLSGMEFVGEVFADFFGLNQSKFQWIIDIKQREDEAIARRAARRAARERQRAAAHDTRLEEGDTDRKVDLHEA